MPLELPISLFEWAVSRPVAPLLPLGHIALLADGPDVGIATHNIALLLAPHADFWFCFGIGDTTAALGFAALQRLLNVGPRGRRAARVLQNEAEIAVRLDRVTVTALTAFAELA